PDLVGGLCDEVDEAERARDRLREDGEEDRDVASEEVRLGGRPAREDLRKDAARERSRKDLSSRQGVHGALLRHRSVGARAGLGGGQGTVVTASLSNPSEERSSASAPSVIGTVCASVTGLVAAKVGAIAPGSVQGTPRRSKSARAEPRGGRVATSSSRKAWSCWLDARMRARSAGPSPSSKSRRPLTER